MKTAAVIMLAGVAGFAVTGILSFAMIPWLKKVNFGQGILDVNPKMHGKHSVPTMGGIMFIIGTVLAILLSVITDKLLGGNIVASGSMIPEELYTKLWSGILTAAAFSMVGFADDYIKILSRQTLGLTIKQMSVLEFFVILAYLTCLYMGMNGAPHMFIPFIGTVEPGFLFWVIGIILVYAAVNAVNITDGVDGLCGSITFTAAVFIAAIAAMKGLFGFTMAGVALAGACLGFVLLNKKLVKVFMGKTGSMFLGGMIVALSYAVGCPMILLLVGIAYFIEFASDVIQIVYYKKSGGKKLLKMAPIHRHLELCGWSKKKITFVFTAVNFAGGVAAVLIMYYGGYIVR